MIVLDTGILVAAAIRNDIDHIRCSELILLLRATGHQLLIPPTVVAEVGYMLATRGNAEKEAEFLDSISEGVFKLTPLDKYHTKRMAQLVRQYSDLKGKGLGTTDASIVAVAERLGVIDIATLDQHFRAITPTHAAHFRILPDDMPR